ncbi:MAG: hypothetical protein QOJ99_632 [Bryobacterales bacterium]|nr:hypothetical protein [Bryobacterales bacterium]
MGNVMDRSHDEQFSELVRAKLLAFPGLTAQELAVELRFRFDSQFLKKLTAASDKQTIYARVGKYYPGERKLR